MFENKPTEIIGENPKGVFWTKQFKLYFIIVLLMLASMAVMLFVYKSSAMNLCNQYCCAAQMQPYFTNGINCECMRRPVTQLFNKTLESENRICEAYQPKLIPLNETRA